jgi:hypothetical protein
MVLCVAARAWILDRSEDVVVVGATSRSALAGQQLEVALSLARQAARILRDFRTRYGLKITPAWMLQMQAVAAGVLMLDPELKQSTRLAPPAAGNDDEIYNTQSAFDETFRCLLGTGVEVMIARGIARMMVSGAETCASGLFIDADGKSSIIRQWISKSCSRSLHARRCRPCPALPGVLRTLRRSSPTFRTLPPSRAMRKLSG